MKQKDLKKLQSLKETLTYKELHKLYETKWPDLKKVSIQAFTKYFSVFRTMPISVDTFYEYVVNTDLYNERKPVDPEIRLELRDKISIKKRQEIARVMQKSDQWIVKLLNGVYPLNQGMYLQILRTYNTLKGKERCLKS